MKKLFPYLAATGPYSVQRARTKVCGCTALVLLASCTNTQVRWDAVKMRQDVMVYYNDQIMENLIKAKKHLPFVHVDIQSLNSSGASSITGSVGYGESITHTGTRAETQVGRIAGSVVSTITNTALRPFSYSASPTRSETLTIIAAPALGAQAQASPAPASPPTLTLSKVTDVTDYTDKKPSGKPAEKHTEEQTLISPPQEPPQTIYDLYQDFADGPYLSFKFAKPEEGTYVPGTLKKWSTKNGSEYYFIANKESDKNEYYEFCKKLFIKGAGGSLEQKVLELSGRIETLQAAPVPP